MLDDEVIAIDLQSGNYYSLRSTAAEIWLLFAQSASIEQITGHFSNAYGVDQETASVDLELFVLRLKEEGLIEVADPQDAAIAFRKPPSESYIAPELEVFTDVQDLLTIDPIHDVDEMGWPQRKKQA